MKSKLLYSSILILAYSFMNAQLGINTPNPQAVFHVDGGKDNVQTGTPSAEQLDNDLIFGADGNTGIGVMPENGARVNIGVNTAVNSQIGKGFRLKDGTEGDGNLLGLINDQGDVAWKKRIATIRGNLGPGYSGPVNSNLAFTTTTISLPPGKWLIRSSILMRVQGTNGTLSDGVFVRLSWADLNPDGSYAPSADAESGNIFGGSYIGVYSLAFGQTIINNSTTATKTYYLVTRTPQIWGTVMNNASWQTLAGNNWGENAIIAFAAN